VDLKKTYLCKNATFMEKLLDRITINTDICHGKPTIRNMRYPVELILDLLSSGMSIAEIIDDYPALEEDDIKACLAFASRLTKIKSIHKIVA
jgi:uncharacterized protein (DUF433 family)